MKIPVLPETPHAIGIRRSLLLSALDRVARSFDKETSLLARARSVTTKQSNIRERLLRRCAPCKGESAGFLEGTAEKIRFSTGLNNEIYASENVLSSTF